MTSSGIVTKYIEKKNKKKKKKKQNCFGILREYGCGVALKDLKTNKSPGSDDIITDIYKIFWSDIKCYLIIIEFFL